MDELKSSQAEFRQTQFITIGSKYQLVKIEIKVISLSDVDNQIADCVTTHLSWSCYRSGTDFRFSYWSLVCTLFLPTETAACNSSYTDGRSCKDASACLYHFIISRI